ncbi:MAG: hypothetical protein KAS66_08340 [Candidatus Omnitrophica bacterium]|nr:hypothetical protein [Candidatus Omnitrophota bacterium]
MYVETKNENTEIPGDLVSRMEVLSDDLAQLKAQEKEIKDQMLIKRGEFDMIVGKYDITAIETDSSAVKVSTSSRFSGWSSEAEVFAAIPRRKQTADTMSPDIKKIRAMVKAGKLEESILKLAVDKEITRATFKLHEED